MPKGNVGHTRPALFAGNDGAETLVLCATFGPNGYRLRRTDGHSSSYGQESFAAFRSDVLEQLDAMREAAIERERETVAKAASPNDDARQAVMA